MTIAERRAANRRRVAIERGQGAPTVSGVRADGLTGTEIVEIWRRSGSIASPVLAKGERVEFAPFGSLARG